MQPIMQAQPRKNIYEDLAAQPSRRAVRGQATGYTHLNIGVALLTAWVMVPG
jgi:hypothetical protein